jgi:predicted nucleic acid-binding protein
LPGSGPATAQARRTTGQEHEKGPGHESPGSTPITSQPAQTARTRSAHFRRAAPIVDAAEFALWLSPHILANVKRVLEDLFKWDQSQADAYLTILISAAEHSSGALLEDVPRAVNDCPDFEDNLILDLAAEVGAMLIVSNDSDLLSMPPWRGTPILMPTAFTAKADAMRRHARRKRR